MFECSIFCLSNSLQFSDTTLNNHFLIINISQSSIKNIRFSPLRLMVPYTSSISEQKKMLNEQIIYVLNVCPPGSPSFVDLSFEVVHGKFISVLDLKLHGQVLDILYCKLRRFYRNNISPPSQAPSSGLCPLTSWLSSWLRRLAQPKYRRRTLISWTFRLQSGNTGTVKIDKRKIFISDSHHDFHVTKASVVGSKLWLKLVELGSFCGDSKCVVLEDKSCPGNMLC